MTLVPDNIVSRRPSVRLGVCICALLACVFGLTGCGPLQVCTPPVIVHGLPPKDAVRDPTRVAALAAGNQRAEQYYHKVERPLQVHTDRPPQLAVALSGGGLRSAVFSLGVLSGLHELEVFPQRTDLLSAVSGGAYTAAWFYAQQVLYGYSPDDLLQPGGVGQKYLQGHADFVKIDSEHPGSLVTIATLGPMSLVNLFANGIFGWHANTPVTSRYYKYRFQRTFFSRDCSSNRSPGCPQQDKTPSVSWQQIQEKISTLNKSNNPESHIPNLILNTTADIGYSYGEVARRGFNSVYEFTPQRFGSEGMGFYCYADPSNPTASKPADCKDWGLELGPLERIAMTSGAAFDTSKLHYRPLRLLVSVLNLDLGHFFPNPHAASNQNWQLALPLLYPFTKPYRLDNQGRRILLSDGGHSDNLGVYSLVRRAPAKIVVADGEYDPKHKFGAYHHLRKMLKDDLGLALSIPDIDGGKPGPVYYGTVGNLPSSEASASATIQIVYIKIPTRSFIRQRCEERKWLKKTSSVPEGAIPDTVCNFLSTNKKFPFNGTFSDLSYDSDQFAAYRDLGMWVVSSSHDELEEKLAYD